MYTVGCLHATSRNKRMNEWVSVWTQTARLWSVCISNTLTDEGVQTNNSRILPSTTHYHYHYHHQHNNTKAAVAIIKSTSPRCVSVCMCAYASETAALSCFANAFQSLCVCEWEITFDIPHIHSISNTTQSCISGTQFAREKDDEHACVYGDVLLCACVRSWVVNVYSREYRNIEAKCRRFQCNAMQCRHNSSGSALLEITTMFTFFTFKWLPTFHRIPSKDKCNCDWNWSDDVISVGV